MKTRQTKDGAAGVSFKETGFHEGRPGEVDLYPAAKLKSRAPFRQATKAPESGPLNTPKDAKAQAGPATAVAALIALLLCLFGVSSARAQYDTNAAAPISLSAPAYVLGVRTNFLMVSKGGSDASGRRNSANAPFATITAAKTNAVAGDMIIVGPGTYTEHDLLKRGVNYYFEPGSRLVWLDPVTGGNGRGFFDDRGTGATTNRILGSVDFYFSSGTNSDSNGLGNTNAVGALVLTNPASDIVFEFHVGDGDAWDNENDWVKINGAAGGAAQPALIYVSRCSRCVVRGEELLSSSSQRSFDFGGGDRGVIESGVYWELGELYLNISHYGKFGTKAGTFGTYAIWAQEPSGANVNNLWVTADLIEASISVSGNSSSPGYRTWFNVKDITVTNNAGSYAMAFQSGGRHYIQASKISNQDTNTATGYSICLAVYDNTEVWCNVEKMSVGKGGTGNNADVYGQWVRCLGSGQTVHLTCQHFEDIGNTNVGFYVSGGTGILEVNGGEMKTSGVALLQTSGRAVLKNMTLCTTNANLAANYPVLISGGVLALQGCKLVAPAGCAASIFAASPATVQTYWSAANVTTNGNITFQPNAGWTVDSHVR